MPGLQWSPEVKIGDVISILGFALTVIGLFFAGVELRRNTAAQTRSTLVERARFLLDITDRYFRDSDVRRFFYAIDYNDFVLEFDEEGNPTSVQYRYSDTPPHEFIGSDEEQWLDRLIYEFDVIGRMIKMGVITSNEVDIIGFQASRVLRNEYVRDYLKWLDGEYKREGRPIPAHSDARYLAELVGHAQERAV